MNSLVNILRKIKHLFLYESTKEVLKELSERHTYLLDALDSFNGDSKAPINREDLMTFPLFKWVDINEDIKIRRRMMLFGNYINFDTIIKKGGRFGYHFHGDAIESCEVIKGITKDLVDGKVYVDGDIMHYEKGEHHEPIALADSILRVIFKP